MAFTLVAGSTSGITVTGSPYLVNIICEETAHVITFVYSDGTTTTVTGSDATDAIAALKALNTHVSISDYHQI
jgi:hypothetical protein